jgi:phage terminase large subunit-like protein
VKWSTACPDWRRRIVARESLIPFAPLYPESAGQALRVFKELVVVDVPGSPTMGECSRDWIFDFVGALFGSYDPESGRRLIKESLLLISKKNTKSTTAAGIMLTALVLNWRQSAEFLIIAPTVEIANNSYYPARDMCRADEELDALFHVQDHVRTITHRTTGASLKVIAADSSTVSGKKGTITLVDELWLFGKMANASDMLREATGGLASRPEGMTIYLSTQSNEAPAGVFKSKLDYARDVRDGLIDDPQFLPVLYEYPEELIKSKAYLDPEQFYITNPNLGASVDVQFIEREFKKAKNSTDPADLPGFLAKHLNIEIGLNLRADRWAGADFWEQQGTGGLTLESLIQRCDVIDVGIDGGGLDDLLGVSAVGRDEKTGQWLAWCKAWAHPTVLERRKSEAARFKDFANSGDLVIVDRSGCGTSCRGGWPDL